MKRHRWQRKQTNTVAAVMNQPDEDEDEDEAPARSVNHGHFHFSISPIINHLKSKNSAIEVFSRHVNKTQW